MHNFDFSGNTILIAEDEDANFMLLSILLKKSNAAVVRARTGLQVVEIVKTQNIDLILMDIKMPLMDGNEATIEVRKLKPQIPIIAQTAYALSEEQEKIKRLNYSDSVTKPIRAVDLLERINQLIGGHPH